MACRSKGSYYIVCTQSNSFLFHNVFKETNINLPPFQVALFNAAQHTNVSSLLKREYKIGTFCVQQPRNNSQTSHAGIACVLLDSFRCRPEEDQSKLSIMRKTKEKISRRKESA